MTHSCTEMLRWCSTSQKVVQRFTRLRPLSSLEPTLSWSGLRNSPTPSVSQTTATPFHPKAFSSFIMSSNYRSEASLSSLYPPEDTPSIHFPNNLDCWIHINQSGTLLVGPKLRWKTKGDQSFAVRTPQYKGQRMLQSLLLKPTSISRR